MIASEQRHVWLADGTWGVSAAGNALDRIQLNVSSISLSGGILSSSALADHGSELP
jgi:hypothetical protein